MVKPIMRPSASSGPKSRNANRFSNALDSNDDGQPSRDVVIISARDNLSIPLHRRNRDLVKDMEAIILSRQDDPFLQNLATRRDKNDDETDDSDAKALLKTENLKDDNCFKPLNQEMLSLVDVHEHMIRSPPPTITSTVEGKPVFSFLNL